MATSGTPMGPCPNSPADRGTLVGRRPHGSGLGVERVLRLTTCVLRSHLPYSHLHDAQADAVAEEPGFLPDAQRGADARSEVVEADGGVGHPVPAQRGHATLA